MKIGDKIINGNTKKNIACFINHSCDPNCILDVKTIMGKKHAYLFASRKIKKGTELTFNYNWGYKDGDMSTPCYCGSKKFCRGFI